MEKNGGPRKEKDTWKKRGLFALVSNRPDPGLQGGETGPIPLPEEDAPPEEELP